MIGRREFAAWLLVVSLGVISLPQEVIELAKVYIVSTVAVITTVLTFIYNMPRLMDYIGKHFAAEFAREYWVQKTVDAKMKKDRDLVRSVIEQETKE